MIDREQYDPHWESRHAWWSNQLKRLSPSDDRPAWAVAQNALHLAHDAQFRTVADYAAFRFAFYRGYAQQFGFHIAFPALPEGATDADVDALCDAAMVQVRHAARIAARPPLVQPEGLMPFGDELRRGWHRTVRKVVVEQSKLAPYGGLKIDAQEWTALIEWRGRSVDICLIRPDSRSLGPDWNVEQVATIVFTELLAGRRCLP